LAHGHNVDESIYLDRPTGSSKRYFIYRAVLADEPRRAQARRLHALVDSTLARLCSVEGEFGRNLDSLADVVSFGAVPAFALYLSTLQGLPYVGLAVCTGFLACGAMCLARFPLVKREGCYLGLPIPPAGLALVFLAAAGTPPVVALAAALALGALMVSRLPFPSVTAALRACKKAAGQGRATGAEELLRGAGGSR